MAAGTVPNQAGRCAPPETSDLMGGTTLDEAMMREVLALSTYYDPDPRTVYARIVNAVAAHYAGTAMVNLLEGDLLRYHLVVSDIPELRAVSTLPLEDTY